MPRFDLSNRTTASNPRSPSNATYEIRQPSPKSRKRELGKRILWTVGAAFLGYGVWRFMESRRDKPPVECVTVNEVEESYDYAE